MSLKCIKNILQMLQTSKTVEKGDFCFFFLFFFIHKMKLELTEKEKKFGKISVQLKEA